MASNNSQLKRFAWGAFGSACMLDFVIAGVIYNTLSLYMSPLLEAIPDMSRTDYSLTLSAMAIVNAVFLFTFGPASGKFGLKKLAVLSSIGVGIAVLCYMIAESYIMIWIAAILLGFFFTFSGGGMTTAMINNWFAKRRVTLIGILFTFSGIAATALSPVVGGWIETVGYKHSFLIEAFIVFAAAIILLFIFKSSPKEIGCKPLWSEENIEKAAETQETVRPSTGFGSLEGIKFAEGKKRPEFWLLVIIGILMGLMHYSVMSTLAVHVTDDLGYTAVIAGTVLSVLYAANTIAPMILGWISDRFGHFTIAIIGIGSMALAMAFIYIAGSSLSVVYVVAFATGIGVCSSRLILSSSTMNFFGPEYYDKYFGIILGCLCIGIALGNPIMQGCYDAFGTYAPAFGIYFFGEVIALALFFVARKKSPYFQANKKAGFLK